MLYLKPEYLPMGAFGADLQAATESASFLIGSIITLGLSYLVFII